jgi:hypothetical protein
MLYRAQLCGYDSEGANNYTSKSNQAQMTARGALSSLVSPPP